MSETATVLVALAVTALVASTPALVYGIRSLIRKRADRDAAPPSTPPEVTHG